MRFKIWRIVLLLLALVGPLASCGPSWQVDLVTPAGTVMPVDRATLGGLEDFVQEVEGEEVVPLERVLVQAGHRAVEELVLVGAEGNRQRFDWAAVADQAWWRYDGRVRIDDQLLAPVRLEVEPPALLARVEADISDIAPTTAAALGLPPPAQATGRALEVPAADHVVLLFLDALGYVRYVEAREAGLIPHLDALGEPLVALTTYPPITSVSTASLLTGSPPAVHGVDRRGIRKTETETLLEVAAAAGRRVVAVEGESLAFNLKGAEMDLSGDRDGDGHTDDNVLANALAVLETGTPGLFFVHFHGIDDAGHTYGPGAPEEQARIAAVDEAVGQLLAALPPGTVVIVFADHGMHDVEEEGRLGNHGHLIERDVFIPIWVATLGE